MKKENAVMIFDLDGTLYPLDNPITKVIDKGFEQLFIEEGHMTQGEIREMEMIYPNVWAALEYKAIDFQLVQKKIYDCIDYELYLPLPNKELAATLSKMENDIYVVSNAPEKHIENVLERLGIRNCIKAYFSAMRECKYSKKLCYKRIKDEYPERTFIVFGDNYELDLAPALELNMEIVKVNRNDLIEQILEFL